MNTCRYHEGNRSSRQWKNALPLMLAAGALCVTSCAHQPARQSPSASPAPTNAPTAAVKSQEVKSTVPPPGKATFSAGEEISLFDGKTLAGWREADFAGRGPVKVEDGKIVLVTGYMTGITWTGALPRMNYEVSLDAMRVDGSDFFCGLTFPVGTNPCSLVVGGWGGGLVGLSSLDGQDAANNETMQTKDFKNGQWYQIRLRVLPNKIQAWIDDEKVVDVVTTERQISIRMEMEPCVPLGVATWSTTGALRNLKIRTL